MLRSFALAVAPVLALPMLACTAAEAPASSNDDAITTTSSNVTFHEQPPIAARLGKAVSATENEGRWSEGRVLGETCVVGEVHSTLDLMKSMGSTTLGATVMSAAGLPPEGSGSGLVRSSATQSFYVNAKEDSLFGPTFTLEEVAAYQEAMRATSTRLAGTAEIRVDHNAFTLQNEHHWVSGSGVDCEERYVRTISAKRFASYGFAIEFKTEADAKEFSVTFYQGINALLLLDPQPVSKFLVEHDAKVEIRVLTSIGLMAHVKPTIAGDVCNAANLTGCRAMVGHLYDVTMSIPTIAGSDDTLDDLYAPGATWGAYSLKTQDYGHVLPAEKPPEG